MTYSNSNKVLLILAKTKQTWSSQTSIAWDPVLRLTQAELVYVEWCRPSMMGHLPLDKFCSVPLHCMFGMPLWRDCASFPICCMDVDPTSHQDSRSFIVLPTLPLYTPLDSRPGLGTALLVSDFLQGCQTNGWFFSKELGSGTINEANHGHI